MDDVWGCIGGFIGGCVFALAWAERHHKPGENTLGLSLYEKRCRWAGYLSLGVILTATVLGVVII